jgi:hypothetical protein
VRRLGAQALDQVAKPRRDRVVVVDECCLAGLRCVYQRGGIGEPRLRDVERRNLVVAEVERRQLLDAGFEEGTLRLGGRGGADRGVAQVARRAPGAPGVGDLARKCGEAAEPVDERALRIRCGERLMRVLAVQRNEPLAERCELRERRGAAVDPGAAAAAGVQHAPQQQRVLATEVVLGQPGAHARRIVDVELGGELRALGTRPQLAQLEAVAEQEAERVEQDRLAGARLAGEHREAALELEVERLDDDEVADRQQAQHQAFRRRSGVSLQWSFWRSIAK